jgi:uncharacterized protein (DUF362 family)
MSEKSKIHLDRVNDISSYREISHSLSRILDLYKPGFNLPSGATLVIKINLCLLKGPETGATVEPMVAKALVEWFNHHYDLRQINLAEADATHLSADMAFQILGWRDYFSTFPNVHLLNLSADERVESKNRKGLYFSKKMMEADCLISLAKLKTHTSQKITCVMKNQFGAISEKYKVIYHPELTQTICDATLSRKPDLCVVDGLISMEGNGPTNGVPKLTKLLIVGNDAFCTDHFCARLMGFTPNKVPHLSLWMRPARL